MKFAPIVLFVYSRPDHTRKTLNALSKNVAASDSVLHVFCDGPKREEHRPKIEETRTVVEGVTGFKDIVIHRSETNRGLKRSIIDGVGTLLKESDRVIVFEDDLVSDPHFLTYMNEGLDRYKDQPQVFSICGYAPPMKGIPSDYPYDAFFSYLNMSWGWGTWPDRWFLTDFEVADFEEFKQDKEAQRRFKRGGPNTVKFLYDQMEGRADTWDIQFNYTLFKQDAFALLPLYSLIENIGADATGTHFKDETDRYDVDLSLAREVKRWPVDITVDPHMARIFRRCHEKTLERALKKGVRILKRTFSK